MPFAAVRRHQFWSVDVRYVEDHQLGTGKPAYVISILENFSRAFLASAISPRQDLTAYLIVLRAAVETHGAPEVLVSDGGGIFRATHAKTIYAALGIEKREIDRGQAWQNYIESNFNVMRRMADYHFAKAASWAELRAVHDRFFHDYNHQPHAAHGDRPKGRRNPAAVLGWVQGAWCDPADLDLRFRHWRLLGERGLTGERAAVWVDGEQLTIEYAADTLAQYRVTVEANDRRLQAVDEPRLFTTGHQSPQPFLPELADLEWRPALPAVPYRPRRTRPGRRETAVTGAGSGSSPGWGSISTTSANKRLTLGHAACIMDLHNRAHPRKRPCPSCHLPCRMAPDQCPWLRVRTRSRSARCCRLR